MSSIDCKPLQRRRRFLVMAALVLPSPGLTQQGSSAFVGQWEGEVEGIGAARLIITGVRPDGRVEGRMEFDLQSFVSRFSDKANSGNDKTNVGLVAGSALHIESALGGSYDLALQGNLLVGTYVRGTTFKGKAAFRKS